ncbi:MAG: DNA polymerase III subunit alpha, partial [Treponema sp.]|nr:DNA polymerase III subunit alpha [Treponema sp.]
AYQKQFFDGCLKNGVGEETIQKIWEMMLSFDGYSFCKPHSASYAIVSFQSAYLRVHHPAEFMAAVLSNQGGFYRSHAYIAEARRMRLLITGPDVNLSRWKYYGSSGTGKGEEKNGSVKTFCRGTVVIGLMAVKGLSVSGAKTLLEERERGGDFVSLDDFSRRVRLNRDDITALCPAGVFDSIAGGLPRPLQARKLLGANALASKAGQRNLFVAEAPPFFGALMKPSVVPNADNDLWEEYRALGFLRNAHPLSLWRDDVLAVKRRVKASRIREHIGRNVIMAGWPVTQKDVWTKDGLTMSFLSLEDETAMYETVIFPKVYDLYNKLLFDQQPLLVYGRVTDDNGAVSLELNRIEVLGKLPV